MDALLKDIGRTGCAGVGGTKSPVRCAMDPTPWKGGFGMKDRRVQAEKKRSQTSELPPPLWGEQRVLAREMSAAATFDESGHLSKPARRFGFLPHTHTIE